MSNDTLTTGQFLAVVTAEYEAQGLSAGYVFHSLTGTPAWADDANSAKVRRRLHKALLPLAAANGITLEYSAW